MEADYLDMSVSVISGVGSLGAHSIPRSSSVDILAGVFKVFRAFISLAFFPNGSQSDLILIQVSFPFDDVKERRLKEVSPAAVRINTSAGCLVLLVRAFIRLLFVHDGSWSDSLFHDLFDQILRDAVAVILPVAFTRLSHLDTIFVRTTALRTKLKTASRIASLILFLANCSSLSARE
jgi:hypothetical protein